MYFYIFETQQRYIYKFGFTNQYNPMDRLKCYNGLNTPDKIVLIKLTKNNEEKKFKMFLQYKKIKLYIGNEFFEYKRDIIYLIREFDAFRINQL